MSAFDQTPENEVDIQRLLGRALGEQYVVRKLMGRGGFAEVYEVWDEELHRRLAVKVLRPDVAWTAGMYNRFLEEARAVARLSHPNILPIHFVGRGDGIVYYAMPFVEGQSLGDLLRGADSPMELDRALNLITAVLEGLQHAHERGLVHRDVKPDNVMLDATTGRPMLVDFGIVKRLDGSAGLTQTGVVVGTPQYMSPEQALGQRDIDARSDLYAVGAMLFQMVTGEPPFDGDTSQEIVAKHISQEPPEPTEINARVPGWLSKVILRCLAKSPSERFQSARAVIEAVAGERMDTSAAGAIGATGTVGERRDRSIEPTLVTPIPAARRPRRIPWGKTAAAMVLIAFAVGAWFWLTAPVLILENALVEPVTLSVNNADHVVMPGARVRVALERGRAAVANWSVLPPLSEDGDTLGVVLGAQIIQTDPRGRMRHRAEAWPADSAYFAPLITNDTDQPLSVIVNAGLAGAHECECLLQPGVTRHHIGYYPLFQNSTVRVRAPDGRIATFENLGPEVNRQSGVVGLRFETRDLEQPRE
jgi:hypothetical protein